MILVLEICLRMNTQYLIPQALQEIDQYRTTGLLSLMTHLVPRYCGSVETEAAPGSQPVVDCDDNDLRLNEEMRTVEDALPSRQSASVEPDKN